MDKALLEGTRKACSESLAKLRAVDVLLPEHGMARVFWKNPVGRKQGLEALHAAEQSARTGEFSAARAILLRNALRSIDRIPELPVVNAVKEKLCMEYQFFAAPQPEWMHQFDPAGYTYEIFTGFSLLERFPTGVFDVEESGFPRSWLAKVPIRDLLPLLRFLVFEMKGRRPYWFPHLAAVRGNIAILREREWNESLLNIVRSMAMQPRIKGILTAAWFYCQETHLVTPHLAFTSRIFREHGAFITSIGPADPRSGFLAGSVERKRRYETGEYRPSETIIFWPRAKAIAWAEGQQDRVPAGARHSSIS